MEIEMKDFAFIVKDGRVMLCIKNNNGDKIRVFSMENKYKDVILNLDSLKYPLYEVDSVVFPVRCSDSFLYTIRNFNQLENAGPVEKRGEITCIDVYRFSGKVINPEEYGALEGFQQKLQREYDRDARNIINKHKLEEAENKNKIEVEKFREF